MLPSEIFEQAAENLDTYGHCRGQYEDDEGKLCMLGSIARVLDLDTKSDISMASMASLFPSEIQEGLAAIVDRVGVGQYSFDTYENHPSISPLAARASAVWHFNDGYALVKHGILEHRAPTEIQDALVDQAKAFRNDGR